MFSLQQNQRKRTEQILPRGKGRDGIVYGWQIMYTHVSKCKIKELKRNKDNKKNIAFFFPV
jgi:hypothetical protein